MDTSCNWQMNRARTSLRRPPAYQPRPPCSVSACTGSAPSLAASRRIASTASSNAAGWLGANPSRQPSRYSRRSLESTSPAAGVAVNRSPNSRTSPGARAVRTRRARRSPPPPPGSRARAARPSRPKVGRDGAGADATGTPVGGDGADRAGAGVRAGQHEDAARAARGARPGALRGARLAVALLAVAGLHLVSAGAVRAQTGTDPARPMPLDPTNRYRCTEEVHPAPFPRRRPLE